MPLEPDFQFSQSNLQDYVTCARRFELKYIERLRWPAIESEPLLEQEALMQQGQRFHHLLHQHAAGLPEAALHAISQQQGLGAWWSAYLASPYNPRHAQSLIPRPFYPEISLSAPLGDYRLGAKIDLLAVKAGESALIIDWKSSQRRPPAEAMQQRLQTIVYRYLLVVAGAEFNNGQPIQPEHIQMIYWFANDPENPISLPYSQAQYEKDTAYLHELLREIETRKSFDLTTDTRHCKFCPFRSLCDRGIKAGTEDDLVLDADDDMDAFDFDFDQIAEQEF